jgi:hypothetical protein
MKTLMMVLLATVLLANLGNAQPPLPGTKTGPTPGGTPSGGTPTTGTVKTVMIADKLQLEGNVAKFYHLYGHRKVADAWMEHTDFHVNFTMPSDCVNVTAWTKLAETLKLDEKIDAKDIQFVVVNSYDGKTLKSATIVTGEKDKRRVHRLLLSGVRTDVSDEAVFEFFCECHKIRVKDFEAKFASGSSK